jgi:hypothetical protein
MDAPVVDRSAVGLVREMAAEHADVRQRAELVANSIA